MLPGGIPLREGPDFAVLEDELEYHIGELSDPKRQSIVGNELVPRLSGEDREEPSVFPSSLTASQRSLQGVSSKPNRRS